MSRPPEDEVDVACCLWAAQWVRAFGLPPQDAASTVGPQGCTLGRVIERHDGAASSTQRDRHWPEVFRGEGLLVSRALAAMTEGERWVIHAHYIARRYDTVTWQRLRFPLRQARIAERLGLSLSDYYRRRDASKGHIRTVLHLETEGVDSLGIFC